MKRLFGISIIWLITLIMQLYTLMILKKTFDYQIFLITLLLIDRLHE